MDSGGETRRVERLGGRGWLEGARDSLARSAPGGATVDDYRATTFKDSPMSGGGGC